MSEYRTHNCGQLRAANAGETVTLAGWMENVREVGSNFAFVVLRDFYGTTQVVVENAEMMQTFKALNKETTVSVTGTVRLRESPNPKQATGAVEVVPESVRVLGRCRYNELPFEINHMWKLWKVQTASMSTMIAASIRRLCRRFPVTKRAQI